LGSKKAKTGRRGVKENTNGTRRLAKTRRFASYESALELISRGAAFRDPNPAFSAAISAQLTVAGARGDSTRQTISLPQLGHKCVEIRLSPSIVKIVKSKPDHAVMTVTVEMDLCRLAFLR
jgi:hypothetical protein